MRLTLRTMLAFMDGILEGPDANELGQKIEESKFASDLVHRIRSSTRRLRLGAPKVDAKGMAADANTVAEYLDNTMPADHVQEFEKVCLESDVHLAEVASSHQVLVTLETFLKRVSNEPGLIGAPIRERMYRIPKEVPTKTTATPATAPTAARQPDNGDGAARSNLGELVQGPPPVASGLATVESRAADAFPAPPPKPVASEARFPLKSLAITLLLGFVLAGVALRAIGPFGPNHPILGFLVGGDRNSNLAPAPDVNATSVPEKTGTKTDSSDSKSDATGTPGNDSRPTEPEEKATNTTAQTETPGKETKENQEKKENVENKSASAKPAANDTNSENPLRNATPEPPPADVAVVPVVPAKPTPMPTDIPARPTETPVPPAANDTPAPPINAALYLSEEQVLARLDKATGTWMALAVNSPLAAGEELMSFPTYRPQVLVAPSVKLTLAGTASWKLHVPDATNIPSITIRFGRATLIPAGEMGNGLKIDVGGRSGLLTFVDIESAAAIDVRLYLAPGENPMTTPPHVIVQLYATSGGIEWKENEQAPVKISAGQVATFIDELTAKVTDAGPIPDWIDGKNLSEIDRSASQDLRKFLVGDRPLSLSLMEQTNYRKVEVRALACRSLCLLDIFEPSLESLGDEQQRSYWHAQFDAIQSSMIQSTESATKLRAAVDKLFNENAATVYHMLIGYSPSELAVSGGKELVDNLESSVMSLRVLAFENLRRITGKTLRFQPEERPEQEKSKVLHWRKLLESGQIVYKVAPAAISSPVAPDEPPKAAPQP